MTLALTIAACALFGALMGLMGGALGMGGGIIAIPALGLLLGMEQQMAQGTTLMVVLPTLIMAARQYHQRVRIDLKVAVYGAASAMSCTWFGAYLALNISSLLLRRSFAVFLFFIGLYYVWQNWFRRPTSGPPAAAGRIQRGHAVLLGMLTGTLSGFFGVGGAILSVPIMTTAFRLPQTTAQALGMTMVIPGGVVALATYAWGGQTDWRIGLAIAAGSIALVPTGVRLAYRLPERRLRAAFAVLLFLSVPLLLANA